jgi:hypothetical protein
MAEREPGASPDYPVVDMPDVLPIFVRSMILGAMATQYVQAVPDLSLMEGFAAAKATWETDWDGDPAPRTFEAAREEVENDLQCWED